MPIELPHETIFYLLEKSMKRYRKLAQKKINDAKYDVSVNQVILLSNLRKEPKSSQVELAELVFKDFASVARMVDILVKKGYLNRVESSIDRRKKDLTLTPSSIAMLDNLMPVIKDYRKTALHKLSKKDTELVRSFLKQLIKNCENHTS